MRHAFIAVSTGTVLLVLGVGWVWPPVLWSLVVVGPLIMQGVVDMTQTRQAVRRNFPLIGHGRYLLEQIRPEINQYFVESNSDGRPFSRNDRSVVYQRAKGELDTLPVRHPARRLRRRLRVDQPLAGAGRARPRVQPRRASAARTARSPTRRRSSTSRR